MTSVDSYVILYYLLNISKQAVSCVVPVECEALEENLKDCTQVNQIFVFVVNEKLKRLYFYLSEMYLNKNITQTLSLKNNRPNYSKVGPVAQSL
jgi:hypothetical protein